MRTIAFRRFQRSKKKKRAKILAKRIYGNNEKKIERCIIMCENLNENPNERKHGYVGTEKDRLTNQEKVADVSLREQLLEIKIPEQERHIDDILYHDFLEWELSLNSADLKTMENHREAGIIT